MRSWPPILLPILMTTSACIPNSALDRDQVRGMIEQAVGINGAPVRIERIYLSGDYALGLWSQGTRKGDILLARRSGQWSTLLCGNGPIRDRIRLERAGVPGFAAEMLAKQIEESG